MVFKRRAPNGKLRKNYYVKIRRLVDGHEKAVVVTTGTSDKRLAQRIEADLKRDAEEVRRGLVDPRAERFRDEAAKPIAAHLADYVSACRDKEAPSGLKEKERHLEWLLAETGARRLDDIRPDEVDARLSALSASGSSARTVNLKLECANAFMNWAVRNQRLRSNPLRVVPRRNELVDRRRERRALTDDETRRLLAVARVRAEADREARLRPLWYLFPLLAGLRRGDLVRMCWRDLDLGTRPVLTIRGGKARRRVDRLPLHPELAGELRIVKPRTALPTARVFPRPVSNQTRQADFERAKIPIETDAGFADLHALRTTFGTRLALQPGITPAVHQRLMRHSTVELSMKYYTKLGLEDLEEHGIANMPGISSRDAGRPTG